MTDEIKAMLEEKAEDVNAREVALFEMLHRTWPYIPWTLTDNETGRHVSDIISDKVFDLYGVRFSLPEGTTKEAHQKKLRSLNR